MTIEKITLISSIITGFVAIIIAYRLMKTEKYKLKHDLFDRRMNVFNQTFEMMNNIILGEKIEDEFFYAFIKSKNIAKFIFSNRVSYKLDYYCKVAFEYRVYYDFKPDKSNIEISEEVQKILNIKSDNIETPEDLLSIIRKYFKDEFAKLNLVFGRDISLD